MDFKSAIQAHLQWKLKLASYLRKPDGTLNAATIEPDNRCELGQWIHGAGAVHAAHPEFSALKQSHARFHHAAADVVRKVDAGKVVTEEIAVGSKSEFGSASSECVKLLLTLSFK